MANFASVRHHRWSTQAPWTKINVLGCLLIWAWCVGKELGGSLILHPFVSSIVRLIVLLIARTDFQYTTIF